MAQPKKTVIPGKISHQIYEILKQEIMSQDIEFGERLINRSLQERFGVSSTPIRDAINHLYLDGLVEQISNGGAHVIRFDLQFGLDINETMSVLSCAALRLCSAPAHRSGALADFTALMLEIGAVSSTEAYIAIDRQIHNVPFVHCGNRELTMLYERYSVLMEMIVRKSFAHKKREQELSSRHMPFMQAFVGGNIKRAIREMERHYERAAEDLVSIFPN